MASARKRIGNPNLGIDCNGDNQSPKVSLYERSREERIKENLERMQKLGIMDLSLKLTAASAPHRRAHKNPSSNPRMASPSPPSGPVRRSSRLKQTTPVSYSEVVLSKKEEDVKLEVGLKREWYTEEHEKLLGSTERSWTLFVDGYGKDGRRIYDPVRGKTCHQCRQKTLGYRTQCSKCNMVQGQFCGDCLYMRYGEHVLEAIENPNWVCPVCRGICNCSLCRQSKGWAPTGSLYRKISQMGFKSVAHYLIQTHHAKASNMKDPDSVDQVSAKRSLFDSSNLGTMTPHSEDYRDENGLNKEKEDKMNAEANSFSNLPTSAKKSLLFSGFGTGSENKETVEASIDDHCQDKLNSTDLGNKGQDGLKCKDESDLHFMDNKATIQMQLESCSKLELKHSFTLEPSSDNIVEILRKEQKKDTIHDAETKGDAVEFEEKEIHCAENNDSNGNASQKKPKGIDLVAATSPDSIIGMSRQMCKQGKDDEKDLTEFSENASDAKQATEIISSQKADCGLKRRILRIDQDSIARRLRPRNSSK